MADVLIRHDIWRLEQDDPWDDVTLAYALAIREMQSRPADDPTSWEYQAAVHAVPDGVTPDKFRDQCQHNSWFFLPWHRMYLYWFEQMIRSTLAGMTEVDITARDTWALPYWNYDRGEDSRRLPAAFREDKLPDGSVNPLLVAKRADYVNAGEPLPALATSASNSLRVVPFSLPIGPGRPAGFGGFVTRWHHFDELTTTPGALEGTPHNDVHGEVGGSGGFMSAFATAPLDPIFWLHHCNIDRLWEVWRAEGDPNHTNPTESGWTNFSFDFHNANGDAVVHHPAQVVETTQLGYQYDDLTVPTPPRRRAPMTTPPSRELPELAGASDAQVELRGQAQAVTFALAQPAELRRREAGEPPSRVYLNVENIEGERNPGLTYGVYLGTIDEPDDTYHVGNVSFFGIERVSDVTREGGHGLRYAFEITELIDRLQDEGRWDPDRVTVTFAPLRPPSPAPQGREAAEAQPGVTIGRISVFYE